MRILHTSDWHLGHRLYERDRGAEQARALDWLLDTIVAEGVELLVVAGDIFDSLNPSNAARNLYYGFLGRLLATNCRRVIIVGGNHDSPSLLDAPADLLSQLNVHVIGGAREDVGEQVIPVYRAENDAEPALLVAAVPYLRDRDLKYSVVGESATDKVERLKGAIRQHYEAVGAAVRGRRSAGTTPVLATGHLFAAGSEDFEDKQTNIYLADKNNIEAGQFPDCFDYVALGHIHRAQSVGGRDHIRYSGSTVPLTFGEARMPQSVCLLELTEAGKTPEVRKITLPRFRRLLSFRGDLEKVTAALKQLVAEQRATRPRELPPWVEVRVETEHPIPLLRAELNELLTPNEAELVDGENHLPRLLRVSPVYVGSAASDTGPPRDNDLEALQPEEVFERLCGGGANYEELLASFRELRGWMQETSAVE